MAAQLRPVEEYTDYLALLVSAHQELTSSDAATKSRGKADFEQMRKELERLLLTLYPELPLLGAGITAEGYKYVGTQVDHLAVDVGGYKALGESEGFSMARTGLSRLEDPGQYRTVNDFGMARAAAKKSGSYPVVVLARLTTEIPDFPRFTPEGAACWLYRVQ